MSPIVLGIFAGVGVLLSLLFWLQRRGDRTVIDRMQSSSRVDGTRDPRAYIHHSSY